MRVTTVIGNQDLSVICKILKILKILTRTLYLKFPPFILLKTILMTKVINILWKEGKIQIAIHPLINVDITEYQFQKIIVDHLKENFTKKTSVCTKRSGWNPFNSFERKGSTLCRESRFDK